MSTLRTTADNVNLNVSQSPFNYALFEDTRRAHDLKATYEESWYTEAMPSVSPDNLLIQVGASHMNTLVFWEDDTLIRASFNGTSIHIVAAAQSIDQARQKVGLLKTRWPAIDDQAKRDEGLIHIYFWSRGTDGSINSVRREIAVPSFSDIEANYPSDTRDRLNFLFRDYKANPEGGKLILWTGEPGTGKTYALRALAREWGQWCDMHYIMDPSEFFTGSMDYLFKVALAEDHIFFDSDEEEKKAAKRWRLIVCEDTGELLSADAKEKTGTALGRFLNICDGIVGQGLQVQILITTNDEIRTFHPAVVRPGRAASQIKFRTFNREEASEWLEQSVTRSHTLAELYAISRGEDPTTVSSSPAGIVP